MATVCFDFKLSSSNRKLRPFVPYTENAILWVTVRIGMCFAGALLERALNEKDHI